MGKLSVRVFDKATQTEIDSERIGFTKINDREHYGRQFITVAVAKEKGIEHQNVGILNEDGSIEAQPGYDFKVDRE